MIVWFCAPRQDFEIELSCISSPKTSDFQGKHTVMAATGGAPRSHVASKQSSESLQTEQLMKQPYLAVLSLTLDQIQAEILPTWRTMVSQSVAAGGPLGLTEASFCAVLLHAVRQCYRQLTQEYCLSVLGKVFADMDAAAQGHVNWDCFVGYLMDKSEQANKRRRMAAASKTGDAAGADDGASGASGQPQCVLSEQPATLPVNTLSGVMEIATRAMFLDPLPILAVVTKSGVLHLAAIGGGRWAGLHTTGEDISASPSPDPCSTEATTTTTTDHAPFFAGTASRKGRGGVGASAGGAPPPQTPVAVTHLRTTRLGAAVQCMTWVHDRELSAAVPGVFAVRSFIAAATSKQRLLIVSSRDWEIKTSVLMPEIHTTLAFCHEDQFLYAGSVSGDVFAYRVGPKGDVSLARRLAVHTDTVTSIAFLPGYRMLTSSTDASVVEVLLYKETFRLMATGAPPGGADGGYQSSTLLLEQEHLRSNDRPSDPAVEPDAAATSSPGYIAASHHYRGGVDAEAETFDADDRTHHHQTVEGLRDLGIGRSRRIPTFLTTSRAPRGSNQNHLHAQLRYDSLASLRYIMRNREEEEARAALSLVGAANAIDAGGDIAPTASPTTRSTDGRASTPSFLSASGISASIVRHSLAQTSTLVYNYTCSMLHVVHAARCKLFVASTADFAIVAFVEGCPNVPAYRLEDLQTPPHFSPMSTIALDATGFMLMSSDRHGVSKLWNLRSFACISTVALFGGGGGPPSVATALAKASATGGAAATQSGLAAVAANNADAHGALCVAISTRASTVLVNTIAQAHIQTVERPADAISGCICDDETDTIVLIAFNPRVPRQLFVVSAASIVFWDILDAKREQTFPSPFLSLTAAQLDPSFSRVVLGSALGDLAVFRADTLRMIRRYSTPFNGGEIVSIFYTGAKQIVAVNERGDVLFCDDSSTLVHHDDSGAGGGLSAGTTSGGSTFDGGAVAGLNDVFPPLRIVPALACFEGVNVRRWLYHGQNHVACALTAEHRMLLLSLDRADYSLRTCPIALEKAETSCSVFLEPYPAMCVATADGKLSLWSLRPHVLNELCLCVWPNVPIGVAPFQERRRPRRADAAGRQKSHDDDTSFRAWGHAATEDADDTLVADEDQDFSKSASATIASVVNLMCWLPPYTIITTDDRRNLVAWDIADVVLQARLLSTQITVKRLTAVATGTASWTHFHEVDRGPVVRVAARTTLPVLAQQLCFVPPNLVCAVDFTTRLHIFALDGSACGSKAPSASCSASSEWDPRTRALLGFIPLATSVVPSPPPPLPSFVSLSEPPENTSAIGTSDDFTSAFGFDVDGDDEDRPPLDPDLVTDHPENHDELRAASLFLGGYWKVPQPVVPAGHAPLSKGGGRHATTAAAAPARGRNPLTDADGASSQPSLAISQGMFEELVQGSPRHSHFTEGEGPVIVAAGTSVAAMDDLDIVSQQTSFASPPQLADGATSGPIAAVAITTTSISVIANVRGLLAKRRDAAAMRLRNHRRWRRCVAVLKMLWLMTKFVAVAKSQASKANFPFTCIDAYVVGYGRSVRTSPSFLSLSLSWTAEREADVGHRASSSSSRGSRSGNGRRRSTKVVSPILDDETRRGSSSTLHASASQRHLLRRTSTAGASASRRQSMLSISRNVDGLELQHKSSEPASLVTSFSVADVGCSSSGAGGAATSQRRMSRKIEGSLDGSRSASGKTARIGPLIGKDVSSSASLKQSLSAVTGGGGGGKKKGNGSSSERTTTGKQQDATRKAPSVADHEHHGDDDATANVDDIPDDFFQWYAAAQKQARAPPAILSKGLPTAAAGVTPVAAAVPTARAVAFGVGDTREVAAASTMNLTTSTPLGASASGDPGGGTRGSSPVRGRSPPGNDSNTAGAPSASPPASPQSPVLADGKSAALARLFTSADGGGIAAVARRVRSVLFRCRNTVPWCGFKSRRGHDVSMARARRRRAVVSSSSSSGGSSGNTSDEDKSESTSSSSSSSSAPDHEYSIDIGSPTASGTHEDEASRLAHMLRRALKDLDRDAHNPSVYGRVLRKIKRRFDPRPRRYAVVDANDTCRTTRRSASDSDANGTSTADRPSSAAEWGSAASLDDATAKGGCVNGDDADAWKSAGGNMRVAGTDRSGLLPAGASMLQRSRYCCAVPSPAAVQAAMYSQSLGYDDSAHRIGDDAHRNGVAAANVDGSVPPVASAPLRAVHGAGWTLLLMPPSDGHHGTTLPSSHAMVSALAPSQRSSRVKESAATHHRQCPSTITIEGPPPTAEVRRPMSAVSTPGHRPPYLTTSTPHGSTVVTPPRRSRQFGVERQSTSTHVAVRSTEATERGGSVTRRPQSAPSGAARSIAPCRHDSSLFVGDDHHVDVADPTQYRKGHPRVDEMAVGHGAVDPPAQLRPPQQAAFARRLPRSDVTTASTPLAGYFSSIGRCPASATPMNASKSATQPLRPGHGSNNSLNEKKSAPPLLVARSAELHPQYARPWSAAPLLPVADLAVPAGDSRDHRAVLVSCLGPPPPPPSRSVDTRVATSLGLAATRPQSAQPLKRQQGWFQVVGAERTATPIPVDRIVADCLRDKATAERAQLILQHSAYRHLRGRGASTL